MNSEWMVLAFCASWIGCICLALSQTRHWRNTAASAAAPPWLRPLGFAAILFALFACFARDGASFAALVWPLVFAVTAFLTAMLLAFRPHWLRLLTRLIG